MSKKKIKFNTDKIVSFVTEEGTEYVRVTRVRTNTEGVRFKEVTFEPYQQTEAEALWESVLDTIGSYETRDAYDKDYL